MKKILVTGATGFIGSYVIRELIKAGHTVVATSSSEQKAKEKSWFPQVQYIPFDLKQFDPCVDYQKYFNDPDAVIHLAWEGLPNYKATFHTDENLPRHFAFLKNLVANGQKDITVTGTCFEYGMQQGSLSENMETKPANPYAIAKDTLRKQLEVLNDELPFYFKWVRLFYMYGKEQGRNSLISQLDMALENNEQEFNMSGGEQVRDFLPVEEVAKNIVKIALQKKIVGIINCCSGKPITVKQFVLDYLALKKKTIKLNLGYYPYTDFEPMAFWGDTTKMNQIIL